jgi:hypothetical protein
LNPVEDFAMVVCNDGTVFLDKILKHLDKKKGVFVSIPIRLGLDKIQPEYLECLKEVFTMEATVGVAGGQEHKALYFCGII